MKVSEGLIRSRHLAHNKRAEIFGKRFIDFDELAAVVEKSDGYCFYCGKKLVEHSPPIKDVWSIDHKLSMCLGGDNIPDNLVIACVECNIIKSTMRHDTFMELLVAITPQLKAKMFDEIYRGSFANKLSREKSQTKSL